MDYRKQFTFYGSIYESARRIKNKAARADFYDAVCAYALTGSEPDLDKLSDAAAVGFVSVKPNLDASRRKAKNGKQGGSKPEAKRKQTEANGKQTTSKPKQTASEYENEREYESEYEIEDENECFLSSMSATAATEDKTAAAAKAPFDLFWDRYPNKVGRADALSAWKDLCISTSISAQILAGLDRWLDSIEWKKEGGRFIPRPAKWLSEQRWEEHPQRALPQGASGQLGKAEMEALQQMLQEDKP